MKNPFTACTSDEPGTIKWKTWNWDDYKQEVDSFAKSLISVGLRPFDVVNIIGIYMIPNMAKILESNPHPD